jgi:hypothetical protein
LAEGVWAVREATGSTLVGTISAVGRTDTHELNVFEIDASGRPVPSAHRLPARRVLLAGSPTSAFAQGIGAVVLATNDHEIEITPVAA